VHPKFCKPKFFLGVKSARNYTKKLIFMGIDTTTLHKVEIVPSTYMTIRDTMYIQVFLHGMEIDQRRE
jgi:hypothetical protein